MVAAGFARPTVITVNLASVDGRLTTAPGVLLLEGDPRWNAAAGSADPYAWMRAVHDPDAILEGSGSFVDRHAQPLAYPPYLGDPDPLYAHFLPAAIVDVAGRRWLAVVDGRGRVRLQFTEWDEPDWVGWHVVVMTSRAADPGHLAWLQERGIPYLVAGAGPVDLGEALRLMRERLGVRTLVSSGGGRLNGALLRAGLIDEIDIEYFPAVIGGRGTPALFDSAPLTSDDSPVALRLLTTEWTDGGHLRLRFAVRPAPAEVRPEP